MLRIATAGSVDDGKSTLIGRLLHDTKTLFEDQLAAVTKASRRYGDGGLNLALLTDGLRAEREQGITIDVAYRYFATPRRSFVVADTPGHAQYTRNMVTGASVSDVAIVLVDATKGLLTQTRRHLYLSALLGVHAVVLAVNKMDQVGWDRAAFHAAVAEAETYLAALPTPVPLIAVPVSALHGDNVVSLSDRSPWYSGPALLDLLETFELTPDDDATVGGRLAVQWVIRAEGRRVYAGRLAGAALHVGDEIVAQPSGLRSTVAALERAGEAVSIAHPGDAITVQLADELDVGRGDVLVAASAAQPPTVTSTVVGDICWMIERPLEVGSRWAVKHLTRTTRAVVEEIVEHRNVTTLEAEPATELQLNDLGRVRLAFATPLVADPYHVLPEGGRLILIDEATNTTAGAVLVRQTSP